MYRRYVMHRTRKMWQAANEADLDAVLANFADTFEYTTLAGDTPLAVTARTKDELSEHLVTVALTFPGATYEVREVMVGGWPALTRCVAVIDVVAPLPDGSRYYNQIVQQVTLCWGKVIRVRAILDLQKLEAALAVVGETERSAA